MKYTDFSGLFNLEGIELALLSTFKLDLTILNGGYWQRLL